MNAATPKASVLVPCYNAAPYVGAALDSVLAQTWPNLEIIVVDDGSTDASADIVRGYADRGVRLICQSNARTGAARNRAFEASSGQFILYLDADDLMSPEHIESLVSAASRGMDVIGMSQWARFRGDWHEADFIPRPAYQDMDGSAWLTLAWEDAEPMTQCGMFLLPRALIEREGGWMPELSFGPCDDFEFFARMIARSRGVRFAPKGKLYYRSGMPGSISQIKNRRAVEMQFQSLLLGTEHLLAIDDSPRSRRSCANILQHFDYGHYPDYADLRAKARARVVELGGARLAPVGPPGFQKLRRIIGWRAARRVQRLAEKLHLNGASHARLRS